MPDIDQLRAFVTAVECGSFSAAARKLGKAQSAVSTTISNLEIDLDLALFDRRGYRPVLTDAGASVLKHAQSVLNSMDMLQGQAESLNAAVEPKFSIWVEDGLMSDRVKNLFFGLANRFPGLELCSELQSRQAVLQAFQTGDADVAFVCQAPRMDHIYQTLGVGFLRSVPVCHADHALAKLPSVGQEHLAQHRQIVEPTHGAQAQEDRIFSPDIWISGSASLRHALVMEGLGWGELPVTTVEKDVLSGEMTVLNYAFAQTSILRPVDFLTASVADQGPVMRWFTKEIATWDQRAWIGDHQVGRR